jgi:hypothetical protein
MKMRTMIVMMMMKKAMMMKINKINYYIFYQNCILLSEDMTIGSKIVGLMEGL